MTKLKFRSSISKFTTEGIENKKVGRFLQNGRGVLGEHALPSPLCSLW